MSYYLIQIDGQTVGKYQTKRDISSEKADIISVNKDEWVSEPLSDYDGDADSLVK